jgi:hypothetical protein
MIYLVDKCTISFAEQDIEDALVNLCRRHDRKGFGGREERIDLGDLGGIGERGAGGAELVND